MTLRSTYGEAPTLILNQPRRGQKVSSRLRHELEVCLSFRFYVAFANQEGVATLLQSLLELEHRGVQGRVLVSQYLNFTDPVALRTLLKIRNLDVRIATEGSVHAKGYFFEKEDRERYILGSSNWTAAALATNTELNVQIDTAPNSPLAVEVNLEFNDQFTKARPLTEEFIRAYETLYQEIRKSAPPPPNIFPQMANREPSMSSGLLPNAMQVEALAALARLRQTGQSKALLISATGTGKTFLSAFDVQAMGARRLLFVVHRENIARAAMTSFQKVFGAERTCGLYTGSRRDVDADFLFCTVQTLSRIDHLELFAADHFDYIVVDESHRAGAASYARFLSHFDPKFLLGMTATPERSDGADIFRYFDHNIGYEIRLQRALEEGMLCPFHYFGVTDLVVQGREINDKATFSCLTCSERVNRILEKATLYSCYDGLVRGLVFCSRVEEARSLSNEFNERGLRTLALDGSTSEDLREAAIRRLEADPADANRLDYLFSVDIFNEGVDIPLCNQVIFLRPTQSAIVFVQQLGRGLRRIEGKDKYLTVIDFIGNYENNFLIPVALFGDRSYDKDRLRRLVLSGHNTIPGTSSVNFDRIARDRIFESINYARTSGLRDLRADFEALRVRLGRVPWMADFVEHDLRDPAAFAEAGIKSWEHIASYYAFVREHARDEVPSLSKKAGRVLAAWTADALNGKSLEEPLLLACLLAHGNAQTGDLDRDHLRLVGQTAPVGRWAAAARSLDLRFRRENVDGRMLAIGESIGVSLVAPDADAFRVSVGLAGLLGEPGFRSFATDLCEYARGKFLAGLRTDLYVRGFVRYRKYNRADVFRILGAEENPVPQNVGGYMVDTARRWCPIFVTYHKKADIKATTQYEDALESPSLLRYFSKNKRTLNSPDVVFFQTARQEQRIPIFVQKSNDEGIEFYYIGDGRPDPASFEQLAMKDDKDLDIPVVRMAFHLDLPVEEGIYDYIVNPIEPTL
jgi:superfamily II DNA or RNA helicase/HKD family nuclease